jgi:ankyrin repeat protein
LPQHNDASARPRAVLYQQYIDEKRMNRIDQELFEATAENNVPEVRFLNVGADVNATNYAGFVALIVASRQGHVHVVVELLKHGADIEAKDSAGGRSLHG